MPLELAMATTADEIDAVRAWLRRLCRGDGARPDRRRPPATPVHRTDGARVLSLSKKTLRAMIDDDPTLPAKFLWNLSKMVCKRLILAH